MMAIKHNLENRIGILFCWILAFKLFLTKVSYKDRNGIPCLILNDDSSFASLYALKSVDCITIGSRVVWNWLCRPFLDDPPNALLIVELGYGIPDGPIQFVESVRASPDKYFNFPPPLHLSDDKFGQSDSAVVIKILIIRLIVAISCELKLKIYFYYYFITYHFI